MKFVICLLCFISTVTDANGMIQRSCNNTRLCFLCGCEEKSDFNISCNESQVIQMEPRGYVMREGDTGCRLDSYKQCKKGIPSTLAKLQDRIEVYKNCTFKNSCKVNIKERIQAGNMRWVNYPFYCHNKTSIQMISSKIETQLTDPIFYFTGEKYKGKKIDCECSVTGSNLIRMEIFFIHLKPRTCFKVKYISETHQLFGCSTNNTILLKTWYVDIGTDLKLEIRGMEPDVEDVLFFQVWGNNLAVKCSGCTNSTDPTTTEHSTKGGNSLDTTIIPLTTEHSTLDGSTLDTSTDRAATKPRASESSTLDSPVPAASNDQTNSAATATLGGILAAVIIINIVGIALYCFLRRRKKQKKSRNIPNNAPGNGEQSQYNYIDITPETNGSSATNRTESNVVQQSDQSKQSEVDALDNIPKTSSSKDKPNNQYHVLEIDTYSAPANTRAGADSKHMPGKGRRKQDDYDHINDGSRSKPTNGDNYNHIDATMAVPRDATPDKTTPYDDYNHIGDQNGLSKDKLKPKEKNQVSGNENTSYVNVNLEPDETPTSTEDVDTYNHLQN